MISFDASRAFRARAGRRIGVATCAALGALAIAGCGAGQITDTATQEPAVNGTLVTLDNIAVRNIHIQAVETGDALQPGEDVDLIFTASNQSPEHGDRLVNITSEIGEVTFTGDGELPAGGVLVVGTPDGVEALEQIEPADTAEATVALTQPIRNGLTYAFTFEFERAGEATVSVPISAGLAPRREAH
ncbi:putative lipoprotein LpqE [Mycolicibacterium chitae]|uniref:LpqE n=1 Tax=Mycolicibacterium chitae TaxID=1792 RepID=A0A3S4VDI8_MYCCI|nr:putative lipoprotein LpqE [Mycolicibacterium chitae]VEG45073.1 lpqE [Mycolicibacterium chitae]